MSYGEIFQRNTLYWGDEFQKFLKEKTVAVIGLGGVGGYALEALCRLGISNFLIGDFDFISPSNINRQILALNSNCGEKKTTAAKRRMLDINPEINVEVFDGFIEEKNLPAIFKNKPDFIIDAIDVIHSKIALIKYAKSYGITVISSFGAGNRIDGTKLQISDISEIKTSDSFTKNVLSKLKKYAGINSGVWAVWSMEHARNLKKVKNIESYVNQNGEKIEYAKFTPASSAVVPAVSGLYMANKVLELIYCDWGKPN